MADPTKYKPHFNYSGWEAAGNKRPKPGASLDTDFANIARSIDETIDALKDLRRSDGKLKNGIVDMDAMEPGLKADFQGYKDDAETARDQAQQARSGAESAQGAAETARDEAQVARDIAEGYASDAVSQGNVPIYASVETVQGLNINPGITAIRTNGYYAPGDGGGALYKRVASEPSHAGKIQSADGSWWELAERALHVRMFGAVGDGISDDTDAVQSAFNRIEDGWTLSVADGVFVVEDLRLENKHNVYVTGPGTLLVKPGATGPTQITAIALCSNIRFVGVTFDGNKSNVSDQRFMVRAWNGQSDIVFENCVFKNTYANALAFAGCLRSGAINCVFLDIGNYHDITGNTHGEDDDRRNAIVYNGGVDSCFSVNCIFDEVGRGCIAFSVGGGDPPVRCYAIGNTITNVDGGIIYLSHATGFRVADNYVSAGGSAANGIEIENSSHGVVANNVVENCGSHGIGIGYSAHDVLITGNVCRDNNQSENSMFAGINMTLKDDDHQSGITITGNKCYDTRQGSAKTQLDAFSVIFVGGSPTIDIDSIRVDESNDFTSYSSSGEEIPNALRRGDRIGVTQFPQIFSLADGETFVLCGDQMRGYIDLTVVNSSSSARLILRPGNNPKVVYDPDNVFVIGDSGDSYAVYRDAGQGKIILKNRYGSTRAFRALSDRLGPA